MKREPLSKVERNTAPSTGGVSPPGIIGNFTIPDCTYLDTASFVEFQLSLVWGNLVDMFVWTFFHETFAFIDVQILSYS